MEINKEMVRAAHLSKCTDFEQVARVCFHQHMGLLREEKKLARKLDVQSDKENINTAV